MGASLRPDIDFGPSPAFPLVHVCTFLGVPPIRCFKNIFAGPEKNPKKKIFCDSIRPQLPRTRRPVFWSGRVGSGRVGSSSSWSSWSSSLSCSMSAMWWKPACASDLSLAASLRCDAPFPWVFCALPLWDLPLLAVFFSDFLMSKCGRNLVQEIR